MKLLRPLVLAAAFSVGAVSAQPQQILTIKPDPRSDHNSAFSQFPQYIDQLVDEFLPGASVVHLRNFYPDTLRSGTEIIDNYPSLPTQVRESILATGKKFDSVIIGGHGSPTGILLELAKLSQTESKYQLYATTSDCPISPESLSDTAQIYLESCSTGKPIQGLDPFAKHLARCTGVPVHSYTEITFTQAMIFDEIAGDFAMLEAGRIPTLPTREHTNHRFRDNYTGIEYIASTEGGRLVDITNNITYWRNDLDSLYLPPSRGIPTDVSSEEWKNYRTYQLLTASNSFLFHGQQVLNIEVLASAAHPTDLVNKVIYYPEETEQASISASNHDFCGSITISWIPYDFLCD